MTNQTYDPGPLPTVPGGYRVILADPPWHFATRSLKGRGRCPDGQGHYETMSQEQLLSLPVRNVAAPHSWLVLWSTFPHLPQALELAEAWGFTYSTGGTWVKRRKNSENWRCGMGYVLRGNPEPFLIFKRGKPPAPPSGRQHLALIDSEIGAHSVKPDQIYNIAESLALDAPCLELFARRRRASWDSWGDQLAPA